jgi:hypothetical protein
MSMRVNSKCAHRVRPPTGPIAKAPDPHGQQGRWLASPVGEDLGVWPGNLFDALTVVSARIDLGNREHQS